MTIGLPSEVPKRVPRTVPSGAAIFLAVFSAVFGPSTPQTRADGPVEAPQTAYSRLYFALQPPADRDTERSVALIEELLEAGRFGEAAPLLEQVFAGPSDYLDPSGKSLRKRLLNAITQADSRGLSVVQSVLSGVYERRLGEAHSIERLRELLAQHPPELFGTAGVVAVARLEESRGAYATAAGLWREASNLAQQSGDWAIALKYSAAANASAMRGGLVPPEDDPRLEAAIAAAKQNRAPVAWLGPGGDSRRQNQAVGGPPIAWRAWRALVKPAIDSDYQQGNRGAAGGMVAFEGLLLAPTNAGLVALSAESGKRLWEIREASSSSQRIEPRYGRLRGGVATDGRLAFVVEPAETRGDRSIGSRGNRAFGEEPSLKLPANTLAAYSVASRGQLRWRFPSKTASKSIESLSLLGPPAVAESRLYAMAEIDQAICLVSLDAETGRLEWTQPIVRCEQRYPDHAESLGVTPTVSDRLIYCPTGRGAVAAIDPLRRQIEWIHYLLVDKSKMRPAKRPAWRGFGRNSWDEDPAAWRHCRVVEAGKKLVVVSPALANLEVLNASTGEPVWTRELLSERYLAAVDENRVTTVGSDSITARDLNRGDKIWTAQLPEGSSPAGEPLRVDTGLVVPLDSGCFALATSEGTVEIIDPDLNPLETGPKLGDLIYHAGAIYSRSGETIECFRQKAPDDLAGDAWRVLASGGGGADQEDLLEGLQIELRERPDDKEAAEFVAACLLKRSQNQSQNQSKPNRSDAAVLGRQIQQLVAGPRGFAYAMLLRIEAAAGQEAASLLADLRQSPAANEVLSPTPGYWATAERLAIAAAGSSAIGSDATSQNAEATLGGGSPIDSAAWSKYQVRADLEVQRPPPGTVNFSSSSRRRRNRREPVMRSRALSFAPTGLGRMPNHLWRVESNNGENAVLVGANRWGERLITTPITSAWTNRSLGSGSTVGLSTDGYWNGWMGLRLEDGFAVYRVDEIDGETDDANQAELSWESTSAASPDFPESPSGPIAEQLHAIGPWGTLSVTGNEVLCRDLLTGGLRWRRQIEVTGGERLRLLVDRHQLLVGGRGTRAVRLSAISGQMLDDDLSIAATRLWRAYAPARSPDEPGRLLIEERTITGREYRVHTTDDFKNPLWRAEAKATGLTTFTNAGLFAMLSAEGELTLVDLRTGLERFSTKLPGKSSQPVRAIRLREHADRLLLEVDRTNPMIDRHRGLADVGGQPLLTGELHCLDPQTGESRWTGHAEVSAMCLMPSPVRDAPVLLLARSQRDVQSKNPIPDLSLVALDLATGGTVYSNYDIPARDSNFPASFWMKAESSGKTSSGKASSGIDTLTVRLGSAWVTLQPTNQPAVPRPPLLARVEDPFASKPKGTKDVGQSVEGLFKSLFQD